MNQTLNIMKAKKFDLIKCSELKTTQYDTEPKERRYYEVTFQGKDYPSVIIKKNIWEDNHIGLFTKLQAQKDKGITHPTLKVFGNVITTRNFFIEDEVKYAIDFLKRTQDFLSGE